MLVDAGANLKDKNIHGETLMHVAVKNENIECINYLLQHNPDLDETDANSMTPLWRALDCQNKNIFHLLLEAGANINEGNNNGGTILHRAVKKGNLTCIRLLLDRQDIQSHLDWLDDDSATPLMWALENDQREIFCLLVNAGANLKIQDSDGQTILHLAVNCKNYNLAEIAYSHDPELLQITDQKGQMPLDLAKKYKRTAFIELFEKKAQIATTDIMGDTTRPICFSGSKMK